MQKADTVVILALAVMCVPDFFSVDVATGATGPPRPSLTLVDRAIPRTKGPGSSITAFAMSPAPV